MVKYFLPTARIPRLEIPENKHGLALLRIAQGFFDLATFRATWGSSQNRKKTTLSPLAVTNAVAGFSFPSLSRSIWRR